MTKPVSGPRGDGNYLHWSSALGGMHCARKTGINPERKRAGHDPHAHGWGGQRPSLLLPGSSLLRWARDQSYPEHPTSLHSSSGPKNRPPPQLFLSCERAWVFLLY